MDLNTAPIKAAINKPIPQPLKSPTQLPKVVVPLYTLKSAPKSINKPTTPQSAPAKKFSLDFGKTPVAKDSAIYQSNFRYKTEQSLKGTLKNYADRKTVADLLWSRRGGGGITKDEIKFGLRKLEASGKLKSDQVKAVRRKFGVY